jgi:hypothetical protein
MLCDTLGTASEAGDFAGCLEKASPRALLLISSCSPSAFIDVVNTEHVLVVLCNPCAVNNVNSRVFIAGKCQEGFLLASSNNRSCL